MDRSASLPLVGTVRTVTSAGRSGQSVAAAVDVLEKRSLFVAAAFGLVGIGTILGAGSVYFFYIRRKLAEHFQFQTNLSLQVGKLRSEVNSLKTQHSENGGSGFGDVVDLPEINNHTLSQNSQNVSPLQRSNLTIANVEQKPLRRRVRSFDSVGTLDDEEYLSATSGSEEEEQLLKNEDTVIGKHVTFEDETVNRDRDAQDFFNTVDRMLEDGVTQQHEAFRLLKLNQSRFECDSNFWWRFAKATHYEGAIAKSKGDVELRRNFVFSACSKAEEALRLNSNSAECHKWFAITLGSKGEFLPISEKIQNGYVFKEHVDKAVQLNPKDSALHHLLGRFCYEVSQLSWFERKVASTLFSSPPTSNHQEALEHFLRAEQIGKPFKENRLFLAKCCIALSDAKGAADWLSSAAQMPIASANDKNAQDEVMKLLPKYEKYLQ